MMATVPHVTFGLGLRKFQADVFLLTRMYMKAVTLNIAPLLGSFRARSIYCGIAWRERYWLSAVRAKAGRTEYAAARARIATSFVKIKGY